MAIQKYLNLLHDNLDTNYNKLSLINQTYYKDENKCITFVYKLERKLERERERNWCKGYAHIRLRQLYLAHHAETFRQPEQEHYRQTDANT